MTDDSLEPITPEESVDWYLEHRHDELREATRRTHRSSLTIFLDWTEDRGLDNLNSLAGRDLMAFKTWRKSQTDINTVTLNGTLAVIQRYLRFCETIEAVEEGIAERVPLPNVPPNEEVKTDVPDGDAVKSIREYTGIFDYATRRHVEFELVAEVGIRLGALRGIDLGDIEPDKSVIHLRDRPGEGGAYGTPLKNGADGERIINVSPDMMKVLKAYIDHNRFEVPDSGEREPLLTSQSGRVSTATIRRDFYKLTQPCEYDLECPHDREPARCDARGSGKASGCPSSFSTHPLRKWSIMDQLDEGIPKEILSDRVDVSVPVLDKHYDQRSEARKSRRRREELEAHLDHYAIADGGEVTGLEERGEE